MVCLLFFLTVEIQMYLERKLPPIPLSRHTLYMPSGKYICYLSRPYRNFLSDLIFIWSIQYYSDYNRRDRFRYLEQMYRIISFMVLGILMVGASYLYHLAEKRLQTPAGGKT